MIDVIGIEQDSLFEVRDMYIPPEDGDLVHEALSYAQKSAVNWLSNLHVTARAMGMDPADLEANALLYAGYIAEHGKPTIDADEAAAMRRRESIYLGTSLDVMEITTDNKVAHVPQAQMAYEGLMLGLGLKARAQGIDHPLVDGFLAAWGVSKNSPLRQALHRDSRSGLLDGYLGKLRYTSMTPELYARSRQVASVIRTRVVSTSIH